MTRWRKGTKQQRSGRAKCFGTGGCKEIEGSYNLHYFTARSMQGAGRFASRASNSRAAHTVRLTCATKGDVTGLFWAVSPGSCFRPERASDARRENVQEPQRADDRQASANRPGQSAQPHTRRGRHRSRKDRPYRSGRPRAGKNFRERCEVNIKTRRRMPRFISRLSDSDAACESSGAAARRGGIVGEGVALAFAVRKCPRRPTPAPLRPQRWFGLLDRLRAE